MVVMVAMVAMEVYNNSNNNNNWQLLDSVLIGVRNSHQPTSQRLILFQNSLSFSIPLNFCNQ
jgi:hypothetical protein